MSEPRQLSEKVTVGGQPTVDDLRRLREQGFAAVVNLRPDGEGNQPLPPDAEGFAAMDSGLSYSHVPVVLGDLDPEQVRKVRAAIDAAQRSRLRALRGGPTCRGAESARHRRRTGGARR